MPSSFAQYDIFRAIAPLAIGILAILLAASFRKEKRAQAATRVYSMFVAVTIGYLAANYLEVNATSEAASTLWSRVLYLFVAPMPGVWLDFCLRFTRAGRGLSRPAMALAAAVPAATIAVVFLPGLDGLLWTNASFFRDGDYVLAVRGHGPWFAGYAVYTYGLFLAGAAVLVRSFASYRRLYGRQAAWVLAGLAIPLAASFVYVLRPFPGLSKDFTPLGYAVGAMLFYVALFHRGIFAIVPVGRSLVVERLSEGVLVIDPEGRVADANPAAMRMLGLGENSLGSRLSAVAPGPIAYAIGSAAPREVRVAGPDGPRYYRVESSPLPRGSLAVISDQTETRALLERVETLALRDELTGLPNRRSFLAEAGRELARARRLGRPFAASMIDLDRFKEINDRRGHSSGDAVLRAFGAILAEEMRAEDIAGRMGGDEFAIASIGEGGAEGLRRLCERLRSRLAAADIRDAAGDPISPTISAGIATWAAPPPPDATVEAILVGADAALYAAKAGGRDRVMTGVAP
jgi:diguanylate cyclase (GGDEF)-like protein